MSTTASTISQTSGNNGFFSVLQNIFNSAGQIAGNVGNIAAGNIPIWAGPQSQNPPQGVQVAPTYQGGGGQTPTTGTVAVGTDYKPILIIGGIALAAVLLLKD